LALSAGWRPVGFFRNLLVRSLQARKASQLPKLAGAYVSGLALIGAIDSLPALQPTRVLPAVAGCSIFPSGHTTPPLR
jgi:hypothetical protein